MKTIKEIAKFAGVSPSTVSKALNNRDDISQKTKERILEITSEYNFTPNAFGKALKSKITKNVGIIFRREKNPLSGNPFYSRVLEGIEAELAINNYNLILNIAPQDVQNDLPKVVLERQVDGVILIGIFENRFIEKLMSEQVNFVLIDPKMYLENCAQVCIDNEHGAFLATDYLIKSGHKKIAFISGSLDRLSFKQRYNGYIKALKFNNIKVNSKLVSTGGLEEGYEHAKSILSNTKITAIFAANDINAIYAYRAIREMDSKIPDDISVIGFDDIDLSKFSIPPLTTIRVYKEEMGSIAVRTLLGLIKNEIKSPITTVVPVKLIERESVKRL